MKPKTLPEKSPADTIKLAAAAVILGAGIVGFYVYEDQAQLIRVFGILFAVMAAIAVAMTTAQGHSLWGFLKDSRVELRKVVWPTRQETLQTTLIVLIVVLIVAIFLWLLDMFLFWAVDAIVRPGGS